MPNPGAHHTGSGICRPPELIASISLDHALQLEQSTERAGQLYMLAEILAALHRQAEALEEHCHVTRELSVHIATWLPSPKKEA